MAKLEMIDEVRGNYTDIRSAGIRIEQLERVREWAKENMRCIECE